MWWRRISRSIPRSVLPIARDGRRARASRSRLSRLRPRQRPDLALRGDLPGDLRRAVDAHQLPEDGGRLQIGREQLTDLDERAQMAALNLKTCCTVLDAGRLDPEQFLQCKGTRAYAARLTTSPISCARPSRTA